MTKSKIFIITIFLCYNFLTLCEAKVNLSPRSYWNVELSNSQNRAAILTLALKKLAKYSKNPAFPQGAYSISQSFRNAFHFFEERNGNAFLKSEERD